MTPTETIDKYRAEMKLPGGASIVPDADLAALLDVAEAAQSIIASNANTVTGWRSIVEALARLGAGGKQKEQHP